MLGSLSARSVAIVKMQALLFAVLAAAVLRLFVGFGFFIGLNAVVSVAYFYVLLTAVRRETGSEFRHHLLFFAVLWLVLQALWVAQAALPATQQYAAFVVIVAALMGLVLGFRAVLGRDYTVGRVVMCDMAAKTAVVETEFDLRSFTNAGKHVVECPKRCAKGERVKVGLRFGYLGGKPKKVL